MNAERRKIITAIEAKLAEIEAQLDELVDEAAGVRDAEEEAFENLPESLQQRDGAEMGKDETYTMAEAIEAARDSIVEAREACNNAKGA
jgi:hypothetical protein